MAGGRPRIEIDEEQFKGLCSIQCTLQEIAAWFKCSEDTIERWCKRQFKLSFAESYKKFSAGGKISLRRYQMRMAEHNPTMAIWLGKQYLGQKDYKEVELSTSDDETIQAMNKFFEDKKNAKIK